MISTFWDTLAKTFTRDFLHLSHTLSTSSTNNTERYDQSGGLCSQLDLQGCIGVLHSGGAVVVVDLII